MNGGAGVDRGLDAVGYQALSADGKKETTNIVLEQFVKVTRATGGLSIPGLYVPSDPGAVDSISANGQISLSFGKLFEKGLTMVTSRCNVKAYNRLLRDVIIEACAKFSFLVSHEVSLDGAVQNEIQFYINIDGVCIL
jgi:threonine dehydrogenase-like Zn-dependent dehydrogenase